MDKRIKVLLVSPYYKKESGGIVTWTKSVLDYSNYDCKTDIIFQNTAFKFKRLIKGSKIRRIIIGSLDSLSIIIRLICNMYFHKPDVVHYTSSAGLALRKDKIVMFIVKKIFNKKFVIHWHFGRIPEIYQNNSSEYQRLKAVHQHADASIVLDVRSKDAMLADGLSNVYVVPNAVTEETSTFSRSLDIDKIQTARSRNEILFVGHILPTKGVYELVKACANINNVRLIVVGPDLTNIISELKDVAKSRDNGEWLTFTGELNRENIFSYYQTCSLFCLPSYSEGFPYVILESMSCGCPIIATSVGAIPEMLDEDCGLLVEQKNVNELKKAIEKVITDPTSSLEMGKRAYHKVQERYSIETIYNSYRYIWNHV